MRRWGSRPGGDVVDGRRPRPAAPASPTMEQGRGRGRGAVEDAPGRRRHPLPTVRGRPVGRRAAGRPGRRVRDPHPRADGGPGRGPVRAGGAGRTGRGDSAPSTTSPSPTRSGDYAGTSWLEAAGDAKDLTAFYALVCAEAKRLGRLGDTDDYETRKAKALGIIAGPQALWTSPATREGRPAETGAAHLYVHVSLTDLATHAAGDPSVGEVERLGPATLDLIRTWLDDSTARILPVLDLHRTNAVDQHDPPTVDARLVILRDRHCVFPWCGRDARACDLDHIVAYVPPIEGGPPGQTTPQNLAPLCRRHHRAKTFTGWTYQRARDGTYSGPAPTAAPGPSDPTAPAARPRPHPPPRAEPRRTPSRPDPRGHSRAVTGRSGAPRQAPTPSDPGF